MDTLLDALQEGRLIELPENDKDHALQLLAHILEAIPSVPTGTDVVGLVMDRERSTNTAIGKGWASPHARVDFDEDLMCVLGWSPTGIDYGSPDGEPVSVIAMYLVPGNQRNHYLREISLLAKALRTYPEMDKLRSADDLDDVRNFLLDLISSAKETVGPDIRARMIRLQTRPEPRTETCLDISNVTVEPLTLVTGPDIRPVVLTQNAALAGFLETVPGLAERLEAEGSFQNGSWRVISRGNMSYQGERVVYDCLAVKVK